MKQKKNTASAAKQTAAQPAAIVRPAENTTRDTVKIVLFSLLLFLAMTVQTGRMTMILTGIALVAALPIGKLSLQNLRNRLCVPVIGLVAFALMQGLAAIYSPFDSYGVAEYYKFLAAFALAVIALVQFEKKHVRGLLWGIAAVCASISLLCIDMGGSQVLFGLFNSAVNALGGDFSSALANSVGMRVNGLYNDANITGAILGPAIILGLHLTLFAQSRKERITASMLLGVSTMGFLVAMSRGAMGAFAVAALVYLAVMGRENRLKLFFLMASTGISVAVTGILAMQNLNSGSFLPDVLALACGALIFALYEFAGEKLEEKLSGHGVIIAAVCGVVLTAVAAFVVVALNTSAPHTFQENETLTRSVELPLGSYTVSGDWDGADTTMVTIYSRTADQELMNVRTDLYSGTMAGAAFEVTTPDVKVYFQMSGEPGDVVREVAVSDGTTLQLGYKWIPEMIAGRLHDGLLQSTSFLQRVQFVKDGWKIFLMRPLFGYGLGSSEGMLTAVQPFYYESKFLHCHILQVMTDTGIVGLLCFLSFMLGVAWMLLRALRSEERVLAAMFLACWVMINGHSLMEINFSIRAFECVGYVLLMLIVVCFGKPLSEKIVKVGGWVLAGCIWLYLAVFGAFLMSHRSVQADVARVTTSDVDLYLNSMRNFARRDVFENEDYQLSFVANAVALGDSRYEDTVQEYVEELRKSGTYPACSGLARYYYLPRGDIQELFACSREGIAQEASAKECWNLQLDFYREEVLDAMNPEQMDVYLEGVMATKAMMDEFSVGRLEKIALSDENQAYLELIESVVSGGLTGDAAYDLLMAAATA